MNRHESLVWAKVRANLEASPDKLRSLNEIEQTVGEKDVVGLDKKTGEYIVSVCSADTPKGPVSVCYDRKGGCHAWKPDRKRRLWIWPPSWASSG